MPAEVRSGVSARDDRSLAGRALRKALDTEACIGDRQRAASCRLEWLVREDTEERRIDPVERILRAARADTDAVYEDEQDHARDLTRFRKRNRRVARFGGRLDRSRRSSRRLAQGGYTERAHVTNRKQESG